MTNTSSTTNTTPTTHATDTTRPTVSVDELCAAYVGTWNATDPQERRASIDRHWSAEAFYANGLQHYEGRDGVELAIARTFEKWGANGYTFVPGKSAQHHHDTVRFVWHMFASDAPEGSEPTSVGTQFLRLDADGRIALDIQFIDR